MIEQARNPVKAAEIEAAFVELLCGDVFDTRLQLASFDLIYSIGVYGEYSPIDDALLARFASLLRPGGVLFITAVDSQSRVSASGMGRPSVFRRFARRIFPFLPGRVRERVNRLLSPDYVSRPELEALFARSEFKEFSVTPYCHVSGWGGRHWDCRAKV
jgi:SAM-dependent methyltransferase